MQSSHNNTLETEANDLSSADCEPEDQVGGKQLLSGPSSSISSPFNDPMMEDFEILYKYSHRTSAVHKQTSLHSFFSSKMPAMGSNGEDLRSTVIPAGSTRTHCTSALSSLRTPESCPRVYQRAKIRKTSSPLTYKDECVQEMVIGTDTTTVDKKRVKTTAQERPRKLCPFYKKVPGTGFTVDAFKYGVIPECTVYFLSHFHSDHYQGLNRRFEGTLYCTKVTGNLVVQKLKVQPSCIHTLHLNAPHEIGGVQVTCLDANHCPGAVLLLFKLSSGMTYLHTGDFRFCSSMLDYPELKGIIVHELYLDTTYCNPKFDFPKQYEAISFAVRKSLEACQRNPNILIICGTYTIGKEKVFRAIAESLGVKVCVTADKKGILDCLEDEWMAENVDTNPNSTNLHVLPMGKLTLASLETYLMQWGSKYSSLLAFKPTGWTYGGQSGSLTSIKPHISGNIVIYGIPYSEHSSFTELKEFVKFVRPHKIIPTVDNFSADRREEMKRTFQQWLTECRPGSVKRQVTLDAFKPFHDKQATLED